MTYGQFFTAEKMYRLVISGGAGSGKIVARLESLDVVVKDVARASPEDNSAFILPLPFYIGGPREPSVLITHPCDVTRAALASSRPDHLRCGDFINSYSSTQKKSRRRAAEGSYSQMR